MPSSPKIERIETTVFRLPMHGALRWGKHGMMAEARHVLVTVHLSDGAFGHAEALPRPTIYGETAHSIPYIIKHELAPRIVGLAAEPTQVLARLHEVKNNQTAKGAIDIALHDALAHSKGVTLAEHMGCTHQRLRVSYILGINDHDTMMAEAQRVYDAGVRVLKVKVGRDWAADVERISYLQEIAPDLDLYVDANECFTAEDAPGRLSALAELGILYCEEPLPVEYVNERARVRAGNYMPLIGDDSCFSLRDVRRELALNTFDILNIKCARTGYTESRQMLNLAASAGKDAMVGSQASSKLGASRNAVFAALKGVNHPSELSFFLKMKEDIVSTDIPIVDGYIALDDMLKVEVDLGRLCDLSIN